MMHGFHNVFAMCIEDELQANDYATSRHFVAKDFCTEHFSNTMTGRRLFLV